ncbi:MAG: hypothetical protein IPI91_00850 [Flavobacteriales bacterium]|nr:hypothetical protein [Flavobacteriales bacterium]
MKEFQSIGDSNYLLNGYINARKVKAKAGKVLFLMFDEKTEKLAKMGPRVRTFMDNKVNTNRIAEKGRRPACCSRPN